MTIISYFLAKSRRQNYIFSDSEDVSKQKENSAEILLNEALDAVKAAGGGCDVTIAEDFMVLAVPREKKT